jgi:hypothetical protein
MDEEIRLSLKDPSQQLSVNLLSILAVSNQSELKRRLDRLNLLNASTDLSDRSWVRREGDEKNHPYKEQDLHPVRNDAPLLCGGVRSRNNSGGARCLVLLRVPVSGREDATTGISKRIHPFFFLEIIFKIFHNAL